MVQKAMDFMEELKKPYFPTETNRNHNLHCVIKKYDLI